MECSGELGKTAAKYTGVLNISSAAIPMLLFQCCDSLARKPVEMAQSVTAGGCKLGGRTAAQSQNRTQLTYTELCRLRVDRPSQYLTAGVT